LINWIPAETAPRDGKQFLAVFKPGVRHVAAWNMPDGKWCAAVLNVGIYKGVWHDTYFENEHFAEEELTAWAEI
jgi:hypothetical protein